MKKIFKGLILLTIGVLIGMNINSKEVKQVITHSTDNYYVEQGECIIKFTDNSYIVSKIN